MRVGFVGDEVPEASDGEVGLCRGGEAAQQREGEGCERQALSDGGEDGFHVGGVKEEECTGAFSQG